MKGSNEYGMRFVSVVAVAAIAVCGGSARAEVVGQPVLLRPPINTKYAELSPCISKDGLALYFASDRPEGVGESDLYVATRPTADSDWETVEHLGTRVNTAASEWGPCISADGLNLSRLRRGLCFAASVIALSSVDPSRSRAA